MIQSNIPNQNLVSTEGIYQGGMEPDYYRKLVEETEINAVCVDDWLSAELKQIVDEMHEGEIIHPALLLQILESLYKYINPSLALDSEGDYQDAGSSIKDLSEKDLYERRDFFQRVRYFDTLEKYGSNYNIRKYCANNFVIPMIRFVAMQLQRHPEGSCYCKVDKVAHGYRDYIQELKQREDTIFYEPGFEFNFVENGGLFERFGSVVEDGQKLLAFGFVSNNVENLIPRNVMVSIISLLLESRDLNGFCLAIPDNCLEERPIIITKIS